MKTVIAAALLAITAAPALAASQKLDGVVILGNSRIPTPQLQAVVTEQPGTTIAADQALADRDAIAAVYQKAKIGVRVAAAIVPTTAGHANVRFTVVESAPAAATTASSSQMLDHVVYSGNKKIASDQLAAASVLKPGAPIDDAAAAADLKAVQGVYEKAKQPGQVAQVFSYPQPGRVVVTYNITELKKKPKAVAGDEGVKTDTSDLPQ